MNTIKMMQVAASHGNGVVKTYTLDIGKVTVYDNYMVAILNEGITLTLERAFELVGISEIHFRYRPFVYITIRKNSYAVDPTLYTQIFLLENLKGIAIVSDKEVDAHNIIIEKHFFKKPMTLHKTLHEAVSWAQSLLN